MFCRKLYKIEKNHHRTLRAIYQYEEFYESFLLKSSSVSVHQKHLHFLVTEIYKSTTQINPEFTWFYFSYNNISYNLWKGPILYFPSMHSTYYGTNSVHFRGSFWFGIIFLEKLNRANQYLNLIPKLKTLVILITDV